MSDYRSRHLQQVEIIEAGPGPAQAQRPRQDAMERQTQSMVAQAKVIAACVISMLGSLLIAVAFFTGLFGNLHQFLGTSSTLMQLFLQWLPSAICIAVAFFLLRKIGYAVKEYKHAELELKVLRDENARENKMVEAECEEMNASAARMRAEARRIDAEAAESHARAQQLLSTLPFDNFGNVAYIDRSIGYVQVFSAQNYSQYPNLTSIHEHNTQRLADGQQSLLAEVSQKQILESIHIPTFAESLHEGTVGPGQEQVLLCYELERSEETGLLTGNISKRQDKLENNSTLFLGGASKSGKTTLMSHLSAQEALMGALIYIIDPHLMHPEKSIAVRMKPLAHTLILPPAMTDAEVRVVLDHAMAEARARVNGKETKYSGRPILFIVDEALDLLGRAKRTDNKEIQQLYADLVLFMRDLGTALNKFDMNGMFATQYVTKNAFKLPAPNGDLDFRDACQSNALLRLPANQAQAMRLLERDELRGVRQLPQGHGYMGFFTGEIIRMASGNVTVADMEMVGRMVQGISNGRTFGFTSQGTARYSHGTQAEPTGTRIIEQGGPGFDPAFSTAQSEHKSERNTAPLKNERYPPVEALEQGTEPVPQRQPKEFTVEQELEFVTLHKGLRSIKKCLTQMHLSYGDYQAYASWCVKKYGLNEER